MLNGIGDWEMSEELQCKYCDTKFERKRYGNYSVRCPKCHRLLENLSDYGFGPVTPFYFSVGSEVVGVVESRAQDYYLNFRGKQIKLKESYLNAVIEAERYIVDKLQIAVKSVPIDIVTERGSLFFFGESFGRPYDNIHKIKSVHYDGELLVICFDQWEELFVYNPKDIESTEKELRIGGASKVKWSYIPYGNHTSYKTITYECKDGEITKTIADKQNPLAIQNEPAVLLTGY